MIKIVGVVIDEIVLLVFDKMRMRFRYENVEIYDVRIFIMCYVIKIKNGVVVFIDEIINRF